MIQYLYNVLLLEYDESVDIYYGTTVRVSLNNLRIKEWK